jgi:hypothetical protein
MNAQDDHGKNKPRLLDQVRNAIRVRHMARSTEKAYVDWILKSNSWAIRSPADDV